MSYSLRNFLFFIAFFSITLLLYRNTIHSRFVFDFADWYFTYQQQGWKGLTQSFNDPSLHHVYHLFYFITLKLFGLHEMPWQLLFCALHSFNAFMIFFVLGKLFSKAQSDFSFQISLFSALLFLISPYQTEVVVWGATIHYLLVLLFALLILYFTLLYSELPKTLLLPSILIIFLSGLFTHEIILSLPFVICVLLIFLPEGFSSLKSREEIFAKIVLPQFGLIALYFLFNRFFLGKWISHYGAATHLQFDSLQLSDSFTRYLMKYFLFAQFLPGSWKESLYKDSLTESASLIIFVGFISLFLLGLFFFKKSLPVKILVVFFVIILITLFPVLNLYFPYWINIQGDRLGYFGSVFIYSFISVSLFTLFRKFAIIFLVAFAIVSVYCLNVNTSNWYKAGEICHSLEENFSFDKSKHYYILNLPDNYNGAYMFRCLGDSKFAQTYKMKKGIDMDKNITEICGYNLQNESDSVIVNIVDSVKLKVELNHWGNWFWRFTEGANSYENELVKIVFDESKHSYLATFKRKTPDDVFIYQAGSQWRVVKGFN